MASEVVGYFGVGISWRDGEALSPSSKAYTLIENPPWNASHPFPEKTNSNWNQHNQQLLGWSGQQTVHLPRKDWQSLIFHVVRSAEKCYGCCLYTSEREKEGAGKERNCLSRRTRTAQEQADIFWLWINLCWKWNVFWILEKWGSGLRSSGNTISLRNHRTLLAQL